MQENDNPLMTPAEIATLFGVERTNIYYYLNRFGAVKPPISETHNLYRREDAVKWWAAIKEYQKNRSKKGKSNERTSTQRP